MDFTDYLMALIILLLSLIKLYLCFYVHKLVEVLFRSSESLFISGSFFYMPKGFKRFLKSGKIGEGRAGYWALLLIYLCSNVIFFGGKFVEFQTTLVMYIVLFQFILLLFDGPEPPEIFIRRVIQNSVVIISLLLTQYAIGMSNGRLDIAISFLAVLNSFIVINLKPLFYIDREEVLFDILIVGFFSYSFLYYSNWKPLAGDYTRIILAEVLFFLLLASKKIWMLYRQIDFNPFSAKGMTPVFLGIILVLMARIG